MPVAVTEVRSRVGPFPFWSHPEWRQRFPWLLQATTDAETDFGLFGEQPIGKVMGRWRELRQVDGIAATVHARQVHGSRVHSWRDPVPEGFVLGDGFDAHLTSVPGTALTISVADCVPVFLAVERPRLVGVVHAGWRGTAAGILENAISEVRASWGVAAGDIWLHCGPSICGRCYEVGPEVHAAVNPQAPPVAGPTPIDLRMALAGRAIALGLQEAKISVSTHCTLCGPGSFHSHRRGDSGRQLGVIALLA